ncbi:hypothetical protein AVEN_199595-1 [Araneus ventricosus]|uniref:Uncharacterized protein n=1 Tax=Araneus ventricosus TaxID=182803 RepID=A0A4Y2J0P3_ARAVE|nr:hypothetical protein AVEN_199595-1 [Araneus ventricosus]
MEKAFRTNTTHFKPTLCRQLKRYAANGTKESERMCCDICVPHLLAALSDMRETDVRSRARNLCAFPLEYKGRRLSDNRSFVTLDEGLKLTITGWPLIIGLTVTGQLMRTACVARLMGKKSPAE